MLIAPIDALQPSSATAHEGVAVSAPRSVATPPAAPPPAAERAPPEPDATPAAVRDAVIAANEALRRQSEAVQFQFEYNRDENVTVVKLVDTESGQVLRQIPSPEMLAIARALDRAQTSLLHNKA